MFCANCRSIRTLVHYAKCYFYVVVVQVLLLFCSSCSVGGIMFTVEKLSAFPRDVQVFSNKEEVEQVVSQHGLEINSSTCAMCPPMSKSMQLPHIFAHKYCGMEFLERSKEEWQMCQIVCNFMKENKKELESETKDFFLSPTCAAKTLVRYCTALSKKFQPPEALQVFLLARACNAHTRIFFRDYVWSTVASNLSFYVAVNLAVVGTEFILL